MTRARSVSGKHVRESWKYYVFCNVNVMQMSLPCDVSHSVSG